MSRLINRRYETEPRKHVRGRGCGITSPPDYFFQRRPSDLRPALTLRLATLVPPFHASRGRWNDESVCTLCTAFNRTHNVAVRVDRWTFRLEATPRHDGTVVRCLFRTRTIDRASRPSNRFETIRRFFPSPSCCFVPRIVYHFESHVLIRFRGRKIAVWMLKLFFLWIFFFFLFVLFFEREGERKRYVSVISIGLDVFIGE